MANESKFLLFVISHFIFVATKCFFLLIFFCSFHYYTSHSHSYKFTHLFTNLIINLTAICYANIRCKLFFIKFHFYLHFLHNWNFILIFCTIYRHKFQILSKKFTRNRCAVEHSALNSIQKWVPKAFWLSCFRACLARSLFVRYHRIFVCSLLDIGFYYCDICCGRKMRNSEIYDNKWAKQKTRLCL